MRRCPAARLSAGASAIVLLKKKKTSAVSFFNPLTQKKTAASLSFFLFFSPSLSLTLFLLDASFLLGQASNTHSPSPGRRARGFPLAPRSHRLSRGFKRSAERSFIFSKSSVVVVVGAPLAVPSCSSWESSRLRSIKQSPRHGRRGAGQPPPGRMVFRGH